MVTDPVEDLGKAEFVPLHRGDYECVSVQALDFDVKAVAPQEYIGALGNSSTRVFPINPGDKLNF